MTQTQSQLQTPSEKISNTALAMGFGAGFTTAGLVWLSMFIMDVLGISTFKDVPEKDMGGWVFCFVVGGILLGIGVGHLVGGFVRYRMELKFEAAGIQLERERSLGRLLKD